MNKEPLVSIIIPTYNRAKLLPRTINSVLKQNYKNWELIVIDDRSTDNTKELIEGYSKKDSRIKYVLNYHKKGPGGARNCGIENAKGKYIAFLDSDDEWFKHHLKDCVDVLEDNNVKVCAPLWYDRRDNKLIRRSENHIKEAIKALNPIKKGDLYIFDKRLGEYIAKGGYSCGNMDTIVFRRDLLKKKGGFNESLRIAEDSEFVFRLILDNDFCWINKFHAVYNEGSDNLVAYDTKSIAKNYYWANQHVKYLKIKKRVIKNSNIKDKKSCFTHIAKSISEKQFEKGYLYRKTKRFKSLMNYLKAMYYNYDPIQIKAIKKLFKPGYYK